MKKWTLILLISMPLPEALAAPLENNLITLSAGPTWYQAGKNQTIWLYDNFPNTYISQNQNQPITSAELFWGFQHRLNTFISGQLGLAFSTATRAKLAGDVWETANPAFNNLTYQYTLHHNQLAVKGLLFSLPISEVYLPYISASLGVSFNQAAHFSQTPKILEVVPGPNFQSRQITALAYTLGIGVRKSIAPHWQFGAGYEFGDWGKSALSETIDQTKLGALTINHIYTHQLQLSLTYLFSEKPL